MKEEQLDEMAYAFGKKRNMLMHNSLEPFESVHVVAYSLARVFIYIMIMKKAGSTIVVKQASLEAPIPSKLLPVSIALIKEKNFPKPNTYAKITKPNSIFIIEYPPAIGTNIPANIADAIVTIGVILNIKDVVSLYIGSFFISLIKSYKG